MCIYVCICVRIYLRVCCRAEFLSAVRDVHMQGLEKQLLCMVREAGVSGGVMGMPSNSPTHHSIIVVLVGFKGWP